MGHILHETLEKAVSAMGVVFAHFGQQTYSKEVSVCFRNHRRNMDPMVYAKHQESVEAVNFTQRTCPKKAKTVLSAGKVRPPFPGQVINRSKRLSNF